MSNYTIEIGKATRWSISDVLNYCNLTHQKSYFAFYKKSKTTRLISLNQNFKANIRLNNMNSFLVPE